MQTRFLKNYRSRRINYNKLHAKIIKQFQQQGQSIDKMRYYDQILFVLDQRTSNGKAPRGVCQELFNQSKNSQGKTSISKMVWAYIENLETAKLCLLRDESKINQLKARENNSDFQSRHHTFVHLQIVQISVYSRFTKDATLSYQIHPSNIPPVTLQNAINPVLNHQFTFKLENSEDFSIVFMDSGISIGQWTFPDHQNIGQGEYHRLVTSENVTFEAKIKYLPKNSSREKVAHVSELNHIESQRRTSKGAFQNLVLFQPFLDHKSRVSMAHDSKVHHNSDAVYGPDAYELEEQQDEGCFSFFGSQVRNLFILLLTLVLAECLFSYYTSIEFLDIMLAIYIIGILYNRDIVTYEDYHRTFVCVIIGFVFMIVKSFLGMAVSPFYDNSGVKLFMAVICTILKLLVIISLTVALNNLHLLAGQRNKYFYNQDEYELDPVQPLAAPPPPVHPTQDEGSIWEDQHARY